METALDRTPEDETARAIDALLDEALSAFQGTAPPAVLSAVRARLEADLLFHPVGRMMLRRTLPDPVVESSGDVARATEESEDAVARRSR